MVSERYMADKNSQAGQYWFKPETMKCFKSRIESDGLEFAHIPNLALFVSSEKTTGPRFYSLRVFDKNTGRVKNSLRGAWELTRTQAFTLLNKMLPQIETPEELDLFGDHSFSATSFKELCSFLES